MTSKIQMTTYSTSSGLAFTPSALHRSLHSILLSMSFIQHFLELLGILLCRSFLLKWPHPLTTCLKYSSFNFATSSSAPFQSQLFHDWLVGSMLYPTDSKYLTPTQHFQTTNSVSIRSFYLPTLQLICTDTHTVWWLVLWFLVTFWLNQDDIISFQRRPIGGCSKPHVVSGTTERCFSWWWIYKSTVHNHLNHYVMTSKPACT